MRSIPVIAGVATLTFALSAVAQSSDPSAPTDQGEGATATEDQLPHGLYSEGRGAMATEGLQPGTYVEDRGAMDTEGLQPGTYSEDQEEKDAEGLQPGTGKLGDNPDGTTSPGERSGNSGQGPLDQGSTGAGQALDKPLNSSPKGQPPGTESVQGIRGSLDEGSPDVPKD